MGGTDLVGGWVVPARLDALDWTHHFLLQILASSATLLVQTLGGCREELMARPLQDQDTPLHTAARKGNLEVVKILVDVKANLESKNKVGAGVGGVRVGGEGRGAEKGCLCSRKKCPTCFLSISYLVLSSECGTLVFLAE